MDKKVVMMGMVFGSIIGGLIPAFFGADIFSWSSTLGSFIGAVIGIWLSFRLINN